MSAAGNKIKVLYGLEAAAGGSLKHLVYLVVHLDKEIFDVTVIISERKTQAIDGDIEKMLESGARVLNIPMQRKISLWRDLQAFFEIRLHLQQNNYDIVHAHSSKAGVLFRVAAWLQGIKTIIYTPHCFYFQGQTGWRHFFYSAIERLMGKISTYIVVSSNEKKYAIDNRIVRNDLLININNAIKFDDYVRPDSLSSVREQLGINTDSIVIGAIGRLTEQKDWITYIKAADEVLEIFPDAVFLIVGDGELKQFLCGLIQDLGLSRNILIVGHRSNIVEMYAAIDIFITTSVWEGLPYVILEAMWHGKPIVATNTGYDDVIIDNENGFLVKLKDYKLLAKRINELICNKVLRSAMGQKGRDQVTAKFSFYNFIKSHEELYKCSFTNRKNWTS